MLGRSHSELDGDLVPGLGLDGNGELQIVISPQALVGIISLTFRTDDRTLGGIIALARCIIGSNPFHLGYTVVTLSLGIRGPGSFFEYLILKSPYPIQYFSFLRNGKYNRLYGSIGRCEGYGTFP